MTWRRVCLQVFAVVAAVVAAGAVVKGQTLVLTAGPDEEQGELTVVAGPTQPQFLEMSPGDEVYWTQDVTLSGASVARFSLRATGWGELVDHADGLTMAVQACTAPYVSTAGAPHCTGTASTVITTTALSQLSSDPAEDDTSRVWQLDNLEAAHPRSFLVTLGLPASAADDDTLMGLTGDFGVGFYASGDVPQESVPTPTATTSTTPTATPSDIVDVPDDEPAIPDTGGPSPWWLRAGVAAFVSGLLAVVFARRRRS